MRKPRARNLPLSILFFSSLCLAFFALPAWAGSVPRVTQIAELTASDGATDHSFGMSVAIGGNIIAAGAPGNFLGAGAAYVFVRPSLRMDEREPDRRARIDLCGIEPG